MKKYITPNIELTVVCVTDIITASGDGIVKSSLVPDVYDVEDSASFM
jgi:hypothetical protein